MMPIKRKVLTLIACFLVLLIVLTGAIMLLLSSEAFSRYLVAQITRYEDHSLMVDQCQGSLLTGLTLQAIEYQYRGHRIAIEQADIDWRPLALLGGRLHLRTLDIKGVQYHSDQPADKMVDTLMTRLKGVVPPFDVIVENAVIHDIEWLSAGNSQAIERMALKLSTDGKTLHLHRLEMDNKALHVSLRGQGELLAPYPFQTEVRWRFRHAADADYRGTWDIRGNAGKIVFTHQLYAPLFVGLGGEMTLDRISPDTFNLVFDGNIDGQHLPPAAIHLSGKGGLQAFNLDALTATCLGGTIAVGGHVTRQSPTEWDLTISGTDIHPGNQWRLWPGKLNFNAGLKGAFTDGHSLVEVNDIEVNGQLLERPFSASGKLHLIGKTITLEDLRLRSGDNRVALDGTVSENSNLRAEFDLPDPYSLWTGFRGHVNGNAVIEGDFRRPRATVTLDGAHMAYGDYKLRQVDATLFIDAANPSRSQGDIRLLEFKVGERYFSDLAVDVSGDFQGHQARVDAMSPSTNISLGFNGSCLKDTCEFSVDTASFDLRPHGAWRLQNPTRLVVGPDAIQPFDTCWLQAKSRICLTSAWDETSGWKNAGDTDAPVLLAMLEMLRDVFNKAHLGWDK